MTNQAERLEKAKDELAKLVPMRGRRNQQYFMRIVMIWLARLDRLQVWLAKQMEIDESDISHWKSGKNVLKGRNLVNLLNAFRKALGTEWSVAEALDALIWLQWDWKDVLRRAEKSEPLTEDMSDFIEWWKDGESPRVRFRVPEKPVIYVERGIYDGLVEDLILVEEHQRAKHRGCILWGATGFGKTTLATALGRDKRVVETFRDGVFFIDAQRDEPEEWLERLGQALKMDYDSIYAWRRWANKPERRFLLIVDDVTTASEWKPVIEGLGSQVVILMTAQNGRHAEGILSKFVVPDQIVSLHVEGLASSEGIDLARRILGRSLTAEEVELVGRLGERLGWHPEALRLSVLDGTDGNWEDVLGAVEQGNLDERVRHLVHRQLTRVGDEGKGQLEGLLQWMKIPEKFKVMSAAAVWDVPASVAGKRLRDLQRAGLLEGIESQKTVKGKVEQLWRVTPVVCKTLHKVKKGNFFQEIMFAIRRGRLAKRIPRQEFEGWDCPWQMRVAFSVWLIVSLPIELLGLLAKRLPIRWQNRWKSQLTSNFIVWQGEKMAWEWEQSDEWTRPPLEFEILLGRQVALAFYVALLIFLGPLVLLIITAGLFSPWLIVKAVMVKAAEGIKWLYFISWVLYLVFIWQSGWVIWSLYQNGAEIRGIEWVLKLARLLGWKEQKDGDQGEETGQDNE